MTLNYESAQHYNISFKVDDGTLIAAENYLNIEVTDVNEPPSFVSTTYYISTVEAAVK